MKLRDFIIQRMGEHVDVDTLINALKREPLSLEEIADKYNVPLGVVDKAISDLRLKKVLLDEDHGLFSVKDTPKQGGKKSLDPFFWKGDWLRFGFVSDNHLGNNFERLDVLNTLYDVFEEEGINIVFNGGNMIEGEASFNRNERHITGFGRQLDYLSEHYPYREGIETWYVTGDDHEGWYNQREGINTGDYMQYEREKKKKFDFKHLGYVEADVELNDGKFEYPMWLRVMHAGGGTAYAHSYAPQKIVESFQGGEKPDILMIGHYHKMSYNYIRNVHTIQMATTCDQTIFMRKKKIEAYVGGGIVEIQRNAMGLISRFKPEFFPFFDKKFYEGKNKYWKI